MYFNQYAFGRRLKECRERIEMTQEELALVTGVEKQQISRIERGSRVCSIDLLVLLASTLHISADYLLTGVSLDREVYRAQLQEIAFQLSMMSCNL